MILKNSLINHFKALAVCLYLVLFALLVIFYLTFNFGFNIQLINFYIAYLSINIIPALFLHLQYYLINKNTEIEILNGEIILSEKNYTLKFDRNDILSITIYMTKNVSIGSNLQFLAFESYHFARIKVKGAENIIITNLITPNVELAIMKLNYSEYQIKRKFFCTLFWD